MKSLEVQYLRPCFLLVVIRILTPVCSEYTGVLFLKRSHMKIKWEIQLQREQSCFKVFGKTPKSSLLFVTDQHLFVKLPCSCRWLPQFTPYDQYTYGIALHYTSVEYYYYNNPTSCFVIEYQLIAPKPIIEYHFYTPHSLCQRANYSGASSACKPLWFPPMFLCLVLRDICKGFTLL